MLSKENRKILRVVLIILLVLLLSRCMGYVRGRVISAETGEPVEGAIVHIEWYGSVPFAGYHYHTSETVTDKRGRFYVLDFIIPVIVGPPKIALYKKGYVSWRQYATFPDKKKRKGFYWRRNNVFRLERFVKGAYSHYHHEEYIGRCLHFEASYKLTKAFHWESMLAMKEYSLYKKKRKQGEKNNEKIWKEIIQELYFTRKENKNE